MTFAVDWALNNYLSMYLTSTLSSCCGGVCKGVEGEGGGGLNFSISGTPRGLKPEMIYTQKYVPTALIGKVVNDRLKSNSFVSSGFVTCIESFEQSVLITSDQ